MLQLFLHWFTKILGTKVKISLCYVLALLFNFKMSPNTAMYAQRLRNGSTFSPVQSSFELSFGKASSDAGGRATFLTTFLHKVSRVTDFCQHTLPVCCAYYITNRW